MKINKILSLSAILLAALAITSCSSRQFQIEGNITNAKDSVLFLENTGLDGVTTVDSVVLAEDGAFDFSEEATDAPEFYRLRIADQIINLSVDSTETIKIKGEYPSMSYKYDVEGSDNCAKIKELSLLQMNLQAQINNIIKDPTLKVSAVNDSIVKVVNGYKDYIKQKYIFAEPNKSYAYFALFQTVVVGGSYNLIFNPRNSEDDIKVFAAVATSWDTFHPGAVRGENLHNIAIEGMKNVRIIRAEANQTIDPSKVNVTNMVDIALPDRNGATRKLSDFNGKVVILDFCSFAENGISEHLIALRELYNKYHAQGLEVYQVSVDTDTHFWQTQSASLPWVSVNDADGVAAANYNVQMLPTYFILNRDGSPYKRDVQIKDINAEIKSLL